MISLQDLLSDSFSLLNASGEPLVFIDCGIMPYRDALELQFTLQNKVITGEIPSLMLLIEHTPSITLGLRKDHNLLLQSETELTEKGIDVIQIRRGGGSTAHNPGQLVIYPIINLTNLKFRVAPFVHYLEQIGIDLLGKTGVSAERVARYPGLWVDGKKIASVGVQISHSVSMHGIAINIMNDLSIFDLMVPCGIDGVEMTSVKKERGTLLSIQELKTYAAERALALLPEFTKQPKEEIHG